MAFFDFLSDIPPYSESEKGIERLNQRHRLIVAPFAEELSGLRVLDLAAHDGRWSYALAGAGAAEVVGVEARGELIERFDLYPETDFKKNVRLIQGDIFKVLQSFIEDGEEFDVVAVYGIFYHIIEHFRLLQMIKDLGATVVLIDSEFSLAKQSLIDVYMEKTELQINAAPQEMGQDRAVIGIPSRRAMDRMARAIGYDIFWADPTNAFQANAPGVSDYFRTKTKRRGFCTLLMPSNPQA